MPNRTKLFASLLLFIFPVLGFAKDKEPAPPCKDDIKSYCKKVKGAENVTKCLNENVQKISVACKADLDDMAENMQIQQSIKNLRTTCKTDLETLCPAVTRGSGRQMKCLRSQQDKLTPTCKDMLANAGIIDAPATAAAPGAAPAMTGATEEAKSATEAAKMPAEVEKAPAEKKAAAPKN